MPVKPIANIFWFRRDLRIEDNAGLYHALRSGLPVLPIFIYDKNILETLPDRDDARVTFIHQAITSLNKSLEAIGSSLYLSFDTPAQVFADLLNEFTIKQVFTNDDYEPYARRRDGEIQELLSNHQVEFHTFKDHVIFDKNEIIKDDSKPYTVFTAYKRKWLQELRSDFHFKAYPTLKYLNNFLKRAPGREFSLSDLSFSESKIPIPVIAFKPVLEKYAETRDYPGIEGTSRIGIHSRFGTISIRELANEANIHSGVWLSELIWRDFYSMILWHFPHSATGSFKKEFDNIIWRNNEDEFKAWCEGNTGYPIVDAGMRQLNATGWMHNRVRMIVASFLCKHLLIDWRWGEAYFARKLIDYDRASNVGGWQWAAGTGNDAAPYFRVFSPELQTKRFDPKLTYIREWIPEFDDPFKYPKPLVEHSFARERALKTYKEALS